ncbi:hypothetical protein HL033_01565 [Neoehrlichia mikurensis]|uniref:Uncharacterized protein n=1 Tax=Neoehrlichia mikurensis TaxID=89586 RepID=A0A9Q9BTT9_9RICK|nr:hypothetical protein [Neoehrlichia mikurensis]QXK92231.1 hypothetical protein IAH97_01560 [Neoehrlichia mikurensis]QXK92686.1 hypothetical protein HUN61_01555 [Neoehrlichia mikurensis]QXK93924.1 hypothetical protein HL033_01565 [Neoehrlichia mikurensis]UTO55073.1 hypothetical protein LUA82_02550 [Neoehrlichia mikurensis]UTO55992.1 hypothetical protein LUA81_02530 [Neoehrlichia mikurensis]
MDKNINNVADNEGDVVDLSLINNQISSQEGKGCPCESSYIYFIPFTIYKPVGSISDVKHEDVQHSDMIVEGGENSILPVGESVDAVSIV